MIIKLAPSFLIFNRIVNKTCFRFLITTLVGVSQGELAKLLNSVGKVICCRHIGACSMFSIHVAKRETGFPAIVGKNSNNV